MNMRPFSLVLLVAACGGAKPSTSTPTSTSGNAPTGTLDSIVTGTMLSCSLDAGVARCWGELGDNTGYTNTPTPTAVDGNLSFVQLSASGRTVCGVTSDGSAHCWGPNTDGQLGTGGTDAGSKKPVAVSGTHVFASVAGGDPTSCGITKDGATLCWGDNGFGQVGNGTHSPDDVLVPTAVAGSQKLAQLSVSASFACGVTTDGAAYCWGSNSDGQLGTGAPITNQTTDVRDTPSKVVGNQTWKQVTTGQFFACGLTTAGAAYCWGQNNYQLGDGGSQSSSTPVAVKGGHVFTAIDAGRDFTCGLTAEGAAFCWGANSAGQLGNGPADPEDLSRTPIAVAGGHAFAALSASDGEHVCGITRDRADVYCWGRNDHGQLGAGATAASNTARSPTPTKVAR